VEGERTVTLWSADGLTVTARRGTGDNLVISGQDLQSGQFFGSEIQEYEYGITVASGDVAKVLQALHAAADADVLDVLEQHGSELVRTGESTWLAAIGIEADFWSRME
jgi:hypothetical protein